MEKVRTHLQDIHACPCSPYSNARENLTHPCSSHGRNFILLPQRENLHSKP